MQFKDIQIRLGMNFAGYAPIDPCLVTLDEMPDLIAVRPTTHVNDRWPQDESTSD